ncbi:STAS domain-containing protein [Streptomyces sp. NPDC005728]|uniref:STAS domain-containing protein n=1 Tax=Streptomyces sp. NPDC005728 TaxID=3157054 RepID=UPI0033CD4C83
MTFLPRPYTPRDLPGRTLLTLPPEVDLCTAPRLYARIVSVARARRLRLLVLDLTRTRFMDSQGAHLIHDVRRLLCPPTEVRVAALPEGLPSRVLILTGVRRDVPVYDDCAAALTS